MSWRNFFLAFDTLSWDFDEVPVEKNSKGFITKFLGQWPTFWWLCDKSGSGDWRLKNVSIACVISYITYKTMVASGMCRSSKVAYTIERTEAWFKFRHRDIKHKIGSLAYEFTRIFYNLSTKDGTLCIFIADSWRFLCGTKSNVIILT